MKVVGIILIILGAMMIMGGVNLAISNFYDFRSSDDLSQFTGAIAVSVLILAGGIVLFRKSNRKKIEP